MLLPIKDLSKFKNRHRFAHMQSPTPSRLTPLRLLLAALVFVASMTWTSCTHGDGYQHLSWMGATEHSNCCCGHDHEEQAAPTEVIRECDSFDCQDQLIAAEEYTQNPSSLSAPSIAFIVSSPVSIVPPEDLVPNPNSSFFGCTDPPHSPHLRLLYGIQQLI
jgi:hypothetical protein